MRSCCPLVEVNDAHQPEGLRAISTIAEIVLVTAAYGVGRIHQFVRDTKSALGTNKDKKR